MSEENRSESAEANVPFLERPVTRRSVLAAMVVTLPMVAPFSLNAQAGTNANGCRAGFYFCTACSKCLANNCTSCNNGKFSDCNNASCLQSSLKSSLQDNGIGTTPFQGGQSSLSDGGFNSNPW